MEYANILFNEPPLVVSPRLAKILGLNEAIVLQQLHYWLQKSPKIKDDRAWIYNSINDWHEQFPFFSVNTIRRTLEKLTADGIVIKGDFNKTSFDKTSWWSIDYEGLDAIIKHYNSIYPKWANGLTQSERADTPKVGEPIPEITQRLPTESISKKEKKPAAAGKPTAFDTLISEFTQCADLAEALRGFIKMRSATKKPMTDRALKMLLVKLNQMGETDDLKIALLDQSIYRGWQDIYPLKGEQAPPPPQQGKLRTPQSPLEQLGEFLKAENG